MVTRLHCYVPGLCPVHRDCRRGYGNKPFLLTRVANARPPSPLASFSVDNARDAALSPGMTAPGPPFGMLIRRHVPKPSASTERHLL